MPLYKGTTEIAGGNLYKGTTEIENVYKNINLIYQNQIPFNSHFLIVGGGGGGGRVWDVSTDEDDYDVWLKGGGGGGGGVRTSFSGATPVTNGGGQALDSQLALTTATEYSIVVGDGGNQYQLGGDSSIGSLITVGGGGSNYNSRNVISSITVPTNGGGGDGSSRGYSAGSAQPYPLSIEYAPLGNTNGPSGNYGFDGGPGYPPGLQSNNNRYLYASSVGHGGGGAGSAASGTTPGSGITSSITGSSITFGAGGSPNNNLASGVVANQTQIGRGGTGGVSANIYYNANHRSGGKGGPGCVILRFPNTRNYTATGSPTLTTDGSDKILQWTTAGTYTITFT
jgi:hypothetical protein